MNDNPRQAPRRSVWRWLLVATAVVAVAASVGLGYAVLAPRPAAAPLPPLRPAPPPAPPGAAPQGPRGGPPPAPAPPPPDTFPRLAWRREVKQGYDFFHKDPSYRFEYPPLEAVVRYYENRAPDTLELLSRPAAPQPPAARFDRSDHRDPEATGPPRVANVNLVHLFRKARLDVLVCDALGNRVLVLSPYESPPAWKVIARGLCCAHAEVVDLDGDGINDVVLACLGNFYATDERVGSV